MKATDNVEPLVKIHRDFFQILELIKQPQIYLDEIASDNPENKNPTLDISSRPLPVSPHQFAKLGELLRGKKEIYETIDLSKYNSWLISAQPSRSVALLQEHDCPAQFIANPLDLGIIEKLNRQKEYSSSFKIFRTSRIGRIYFTYFSYCCRHR